MPTVRVEWYEGRTHEQKAELAKAITEVVARIGKTTPEATQVIFYDVPKSAWATAGKLASD
ncbi:MAG: tautomerase family protein [Chloroflexi bacterium]|nr:tautomerase family protein [Chloroflexota bacterium]